MRTVIFILLALVTSCKTYKRVNIVRDYRDEWGIMRTIWDVKKYQRSNDSLLWSRRDTTLSDMESINGFIYGN